MKKIFILMLGVLLTCLLVASCGSGDTPDDTDVNTDDATKETVNGTDDSTEDDTSEVTDDGELTDNGGDSTDDETAGGSETDTDEDGTDTEPSEDEETTPEKAKHMVNFYLDGELLESAEFEEGYTLLPSDYPYVPESPGYRIKWPSVTVGTEDIDVHAEREDNNTTPPHFFDTKN